MTRSYILYFFVLLLPFGINAQMEVQDAVTPPITPIGLIENIFLGSGVEIIDIQHEGADFAVGFFKNAEANIGIDRGIVMSTGRAASTRMDNNIIPPYGADAPGIELASEPAAAGVSDVDINQIVGNPTLPQDMSKFTITFIPVSDTLRFRYVWGSEEYPQYTCSDFNDIFGFFISGPGISGPFENGGENIALIPGTSLPVTINNLNGGIVGSSGDPINCSPPNGSLTYSQFYNNNENSNTQPVYNGFTTVLTAEAIVVPCEEYTIKLVISDINDGALDSGVFLEAKSFGTGSLDVTTRTVSLDETLAEGCSDGQIVFEVPNAPLVDFPIDINLLGTATNGIDYETILNDLFIPAGDTSVTLNITPLEDNISEPLESITFDVRINPCKRDTFSIFIRDNELEGAELARDTTVCAGDTVAYNGLSPTIIPPALSFNNDNDLFLEFPETAYSSVIDVSNVFPKIIGPGVVESICLNINHVWVDDLDIYIVSPSGAFLELTTDNGANGMNYENSCFTPSATTVVSSPGPVAPATSAPFTGDWLPEGPWSDLWGGETNGDWELILIDDAMGFEGSLLDWSITFQQIYDIDYSWSPNMEITCDSCPMTQAFPSDTTTYVLSTADSYGCIVNDSTTINPVNQLPGPLISCGDITNSSLSFVWDAVNGSSGYEVSIGGGPWISPNTSDFEHLISGLGLADTIDIEVRGMFSCGAESSSFQCQTPICATPDLNLISVQNVSCFGDSDGEIRVMASGGLGSYVYTIGSEINATGIFTGLSQGTYEVNVVDAFPCPQTLEVVVEEPEQILIATQVNEQISCNGADDGVATAVISGGVGPYSFNWESVQFDSIATGLSPGNHVLNFMDANGCDFMRSVIITEPMVLSAIQDSTSVSCNGDTNGTATVAPFGGTAPYEYLWDIPAGGQMTPTANSLGPGIYAVSITDDSLCLYTTTVEILEPDVITNTITGTDPLCNNSEDGTAVATTMGGSPNYSYQWNDPANSTTALLSNVAADTYIVTIRDENGCEHIDSIVLDNPIAIQLSTVQTDLVCAGVNSGSITVTAMDQVGTAVYAWDNGPTTAQNSNLLAGEYCVIVRDDNNCEEEICATILEPEEIEVVGTITNAGCNGQTNGVIQISISGGLGPYDILWDGGEIDSLINNLSAGDYSAMITDGNNCMFEYTGTVSETPPFLVDLNVQNIACSGNADGQIFTNITGTNAQLTYDWMGPNGFSSSAVNLFDLEAGTYSVNIMDEDGCTVSDTVELDEPEAVLSEFLVEDVQCFGEANGIAIIQIEDGAAPFQYSIDDGSSFQMEPSFNGLIAGDYGVVIQDANGCEFLEDLTVEEPMELNINIDSIYQIKFGEQVNLNATVTGFNSIDLIEWNPDTSLSCNNCLNPNATPEFTTIYTLTIWDVEGCVVEKSLRIEVNREPSVYVPNAFSPNEDGINDLLTIYTDETLVQEIESFLIFDRWGEQVYAVYNKLPGDAGPGWDGKLNEIKMNPAVFSWAAKIILIDGKINIYSGDITLLK